MEYRKLSKELQAPLAELRESIVQRCPLQEDVAKGDVSPAVFYDFLTEKLYQAYQLGREKMPASGYIVVNTAHESVEFEPILGVVCQEDAWVYFDRAEAYELRDGLSKEADNPPTRVFKVVEDSERAGGKPCADESQ